MHVAIDARLVHYQQAGIARYISRLIQEFEALPRSTEFTVLLSRKDKSSTVAKSSLNRARMWTPCHNHFEQMALPVELLAKGIDLLHSPDFIPPFFRRCKSVVTIHDLAFLLYPDILTAESRRYYSQVFRAARSADAIIAVSNSTKQDIVSRLRVPERKVFVIHHGVDPSFRPLGQQNSAQEFLRKTGITPPFVLFVGTVEPRKNLGTLLRAFAQVLASKPGEIGEDGHLPQLVVAGRKGWLYDDVFSQVQSLGLQDRVVFAGAQDANNLVQLYNSALMLALPSVYEGFGLTALEAMACGTPCIVSNTSSLPEVVGDAAVKVDPLDVRAWTQAMAGLLSNSNRRRELANRGLERARQFTWSDAAQKTLEVYRLASGGRC